MRDRQLVQRGKEMTFAERKNLKSKIEADLELLIDECPFYEERKRLEEVLESLRETYLTRNTDE